MRHLFVCTNAIGSGKPTCGARGGNAILDAVRRELLVRGALGVKATACACLGPCFDGPNAVIYGDGEPSTWYGGLAAADAPELAQHLVDGTVLATRRTSAPGGD